MNRPFPRRCGTCGEKSVNPTTLESYSSEIRHDGKLHSVVAKDVPVLRCDNCASVLFGEAAESVIETALRDQLHLLQPTCIRANLKKLEIRQNVLAQHLGAAPETVCRWGTGSAIQSRMPDRFLRAYFALPVLRDFLRELSLNPSLGEEVVLSRRLQQFTDKEIVGKTGGTHIEDIPYSGASNHNYALAA